MMDKANGVAAAPAQPVDPQLAQRQTDEFKAGLLQNATAAIIEILEAHKQAHGLKDIEAVTVRAALFTFANFLNNNKKFVPTPETDTLINIGIEVIPTAAVEAKKRSEDKRIITPGS